jgi:tetratricopeptide (TPR) repeat protein
MPDNSKSRGQYMSLLEYDVKENPWNARNAFYYARELGFHNRWAESIEAVERYITLPEANWANERCYARRVQGRAYDQLGQHANALKSFRQACDEAPGTREPWVDLAESHYKYSEWDECYIAVKRALTIENKEDVYTVDPECWSAKPYDLGALAAWNIGLIPKAVEWGTRACELKPDDPRLAKNLVYYRGESK